MKTLLISLGFILISHAQIQAVSQSHTFVLVHGAWHGSWTYYKLKYQLEKAGHKAICVNLPGHGIDTTFPGNVTLADYQNAIVNVLDSITGKVILVGHSMGGIAISMAAEARPNKIDKLVYLAAFMLTNGYSMLEIAMQDRTSLIGSSLIIDSVNNTVDLARENISDIFYDTSTANYVILSKLLLKKNPLKPLATPLTLTDANYGSVRRFYISTKLDKAITPAFQNLMISESPCEKVYKINSEHSPFFSATKKLKKKLILIGDHEESPKTTVKSVKPEEKPLNFTTEFKNGGLHIHLNEEFKSGSVSFITLNGDILNVIELNSRLSDFNIPIGIYTNKIIIAIINIDDVCYNRKFRIRDY